ncbi:MAG: hypothetical protein P1T08_13225 [Acidimicrobiia bacterium]|nr:hypothetical protein [Acidimicrobiia bacterium]
MTTSPSRLEGVCWFPHLPDPLVGCWYLDEHWDHDLHQRTGIGQLLYRAKTYEGKPGERSAADALGELMQVGAQIVRDKRQFPLRQVTLVVPVPAYPPKHPHNLPDVLAHHVGQSLGIECDQRLILKDLATLPAKRSPSHQVASDIREAFHVTRRLRGETILLVDDLIHNGTTLGTLAGMLVAAGAGRTGGFVASRARRGMTD